MLQIKYMCYYYSQRRDAFGPNGNIGDHGHTVFEIHILQNPGR